MTWHRIDKIRIKTGSSLADMAALLGVGVSMLMMVKTGKRNLSAKAIYRLEQAEKAAGIESPAISVADAIHRIETATGEDLEFWKAHNVASRLSDLREQIAAGSITNSELLKTLNREIDVLKAPATTAPARRKK